MMLSLDSNVVIDLANGDHDLVRGNFTAAQRSGASLHVSPQAVHEVTYGALISARPMHHSELLHRVLIGVSHEPFTPGDAELSAKVRADRRRLGKPIGIIDSMIAAHALTRGMTVVTSDTADFDNIPGLSVVDWRAADQIVDS